MKDKLLRLRDWFVEKTFLIELYFKHKSREKLVCRMGEIYFAKIGVNVGAEIDKHRPVLVFQGMDYFISNSDLVFVFPVTSNNKKRKYRVIFESSDICGTGLRMERYYYSKHDLFQKFAL